jgi:ornithine cyclodeaminase
MILSMLILSRGEVEALLDLDALVDALALVMMELSAGTTSMPGRMAAVVAEKDAFLASMLSYAPGVGALSAKLMSVFPGNARGLLATHQGVIVTFDPATGQPLALMDAAYITAMRTAAGSALATRALSRPDAEVMALLGTGVQARAHARMIPRVRRVRELRIAGRDRAKATALADELARDLGLPARAVDDYARAVEGADIVCATTHSPDPVVRGQWLAPGTHVNSVGYNPSGRELDDAVVASALVVVESREAALAPFPSGANDLTQPIRDGVIGAEHVQTEIGEVLAGTRPGRESPEQITLYKSVGVAVQDAAAATLVLSAARERGVGRTVEV